LRTTLQAGGEVGRNVALGADRDALDLNIRMELLEIGDVGVPLRQGLAAGAQSTMIVVLPPDAEAELFLLLLPQAARPSPTVVTSAIAATLR